MPREYRSLLQFTLHVSDHFIGRIKRTKSAAGFDIGLDFGELGVDGAALGWGVLVVCGGELRAINDDLGK